MRKPLGLWQLGGALAWLALAPALPVSGQLLGPEFRVNSYTTSHQQFPAVAADAAGNFVVVWASQGQDDPDFAGVFGQRYDAAGAPLGGEFQVNSYTTQIQSKPAIAIDGAGMFVVVWESSGQDGSGRSVAGQKFDALGFPAGGEFQVNSYTTDQQLTPAVAAAFSGEFVVVWQSNTQDGSSYGVFGRRFSAAGVPQGGDFQVNNYTTGPQRDPAVAMMPPATSSSPGRAIPRTARSTASSGAVSMPLERPRGPEFPVNTITGNNQVVPAVAADGVGNFVVVWEDKAEDGSDYGIFGQRYDSAGATLGANSGSTPGRPSRSAIQRSPKAPPASSS